MEEEEGNEVRGCHAPRFEISVMYPVTTEQVAFCLDFHTMGKWKYVSACMDRWRYEQSPDYYEEKMKNKLYQRMSIYKNELRRKANLAN